MIIGAKKCGTSAVLNFIRYHSKFKISFWEETHFFDGFYKLGGKYDMNFYKSIMPNVTRSEYLLEKTPRYIAQEQIPQDIYEFYQSYGSGIERHESQLKFVLVLCNPSKRVFSDYQHTLSHSLNKQTQEYVGLGWKMTHGYNNFTDFITQSIRFIENVESHPDYVGKMSQDEFINKSNSRQVKELQLMALTKGIYYNQVLNYLKYFSLDQFIFIDGDKLITDPAGEMIKFQNKLNIELEITESDFILNEEKGFYCFSKSENQSKNSEDQTQHTGGLNRSKQAGCLPNGKGRTKGINKENSITEVDEKILAEFYQPYNQKLFDLIGETFDW